MNVLSEIIFTVSCKKNYKIVLIKHQAPSPRHKGIQELHEELRANIVSETIFMLVDEFSTY